MNQTINHLSNLRYPHGLRRYNTFTIFINKNKILSLRRESNPAQGKKIDTILADCINTTMKNTYVALLSRVMPQSQ